MMMSFLVVLAAESAHNSIKGIGVAVGKRIEVIDHRIFALLLTTGE